MTVRDKEFGERVARLGFPLLQADQKMETNETLAEVVKSGDLRLWEGFPVMLANSIEAHEFDYQQVRSYLSQSKDGLSELDCLVALSLALYQTLDVNRQEFKNLRDWLGKRALAGDFVRALESNGELNACGRPMSAERLK